MELLIAILDELNNSYPALDAEDLTAQVNRRYLLNECYTVDQVEHALRILEDKQLVYQILPKMYRPITMYIPEPRQPEPVKKPTVIESLVGFFRDKVASL